MAPTGSTMARGATARAFKTALHDGATQLGVLCSTESAQIIELSAWHGVDYVIVDMEHGDGTNMGSVLSAIRAADAARIPCLVRVPEPTVTFTQRLLDWGAAGIVVPHVRSRADAELAVALCKYPPDGTRSASTMVRAARYCGAAEWDAYWRDANTSTVVGVLVEDGKGVSNLDDIASAPGIDFLWIGLGDLSQSLGVPRGTPQLDQARIAGLNAAKHNGIPALGSLPMSFATPREERRRDFAKAYDEGYRMFYVSDAQLYRSALAELVAVSSE